MKDGYEREGFPALFGRHEVIEAAQGGLARVATFANPRYGHAHDGPAKHGEVEGRGAPTHPAAIFAGDDIQPQVEPRFDAPVTAVGVEHGFQVEFGCRAGSDQVFGFDLVGVLFIAVNAARETGGLLDKREVGGGSRGGKGPQTARLHPLAVKLTLLQGRRAGRRGKKRASDLGRVVARFRRRLSGCP